MFGCYIVLIGLIFMPILVGEEGVEEIRMISQLNNNIKFCIYSFIIFMFFCISILNIAAVGFLQGGVFDRIGFCVCLTVNLFVHLRFMQKKINGNNCTGKCKILKNIWLCCVIIYTLLLGSCLFKMNRMIIYLAIIIYEIYVICIVAFNFYFEEGSLKEWEEIKHELLPLKQLSVSQYREWAKKRELKLRRQTLAFAAVYQAVFIVFMLAAAKRISVLAVLIILILYSLTLGSLLLRWNRRLKDIESREIESACRGRAVIETSSPFRIRYMDSEGEFQSRVVEKLQRKKYKQGTLVDIVMENGEVVLAERNLPE